jgi:hypothetical protein
VQGTERNLALAETALAKLRAALFPQSVIAGPPLLSPSKERRDPAIHTSAPPGQKKDVAGTAEGRPGVTALPRRPEHDEM